MDKLQNRVREWIQTAFPDSTWNPKVRALLVLEEAIELAQAFDIPLEKAREQLEHTYSRPKGEPAQELAGVQLTLFATASAMSLSAMDVTERELARAWRHIDHIREKNKHKVKVDA
jgi:NTP pyrophosphatase (non-canonical NTP hydrolase)